ncbi:MAG TPA: DUF2119 family protein [Methanobacteriaceae archaeon]|nr:DUF2119 family protein [Methanobacteriaceae archaeon]
METSFSRALNEGLGPARLFVGGVHGKESQTTILAMRNFPLSVLKNGKLFLHNFTVSPYISTLERHYYDTPTGLELLDLIEKIQPTIYLELHCYHLSSYFQLTREERKKESGIPALVELDKKVLIGSISPIIRSVFFKKYDFPFILEMPCDPSVESLEVYLKVMEVAANSNDRFSILKKLEELYPLAVDKLRRYFVDFSDNFLILFEKTRKHAQKIDSSNSNDLEVFIKDLNEKLDLNLNSIQLNQVKEAVLIFLNYKNNKQAID